MLSGDKTKGRRMYAMKLMSDVSMEDFKDTQLIGGETHITRRGQLNL